MDTPTDIDRLIEDGLNLYGAGDLDGALAAWEQALSVDPENAQANSYVDYVRQNYDLLTGEVSNDEQKVPFGLDEEPYQIEILPGELERATVPALVAPSVAPATPVVKDDVDEGWFMEEEKSGPRPATIALELEPEAAADEHPAVSFDDATREYQNKRPPANPATQDARQEFAEVELTPGLGTDTPAGFGSQPTNVKERDTGFVRPATKPGETKRAASQAPELAPSRMPGDTADPYGSMELPSNDAPPAMSASVSLSYDATEPRAEQPIVGQEPPTTRQPLSPAALELINSLPNPAAARTDTANLPPAIRPPAVAPAPIISSTTTQDFESQKTNAAMARPTGAASAPTRELTDFKVPGFDANLVSAPTRDLGLRPLNIPGVSPDGDITKSIKPAPARSGDEGTRMDVILPFDPIDARSAQILDEIDEGAPDNEPKDEQTRRRITALFERAVAWGNGGELDKAVAAIDLALSEDPNSALGQKLIHRHRDMMMQVFQAFLGDLDRQPVLARPLHELANAPISPRAAFLLSRIDGTLTLDELLDVSGMPRIEAYRYLCQLFLRGILR